MNDDSAEVADGAGVEEFVSGAVARIPGRFVVNEDVNLGATSGGGDGLGVFVGCGEWLFYHYRNGITRTGFDDFAMVDGRGVAEDGLRVGGAQEFVEVGVIQGCVEFVFGGVAIEEG